ncbi:NAD(P)/FAD-dependent oxidoreductase [Desulfurella sp.]|uniref:NAD(P)/FAD-dependent oxidoreductase n=1 Tax=Desulfurella sp. TaxID=1962857 RepID=UPI003D0A4653
MKPKIVILGCGFAGFGAFYSLAKKLKEEAELTVIDSSVFSLSKPILPEVAFGERALNEALIPIGSTIEKFNHKFIRKEVKLIKPQLNQVILTDDTIVDYDYLLISVGAVKDYDAIEGFNEYGYSICDYTQALRFLDRRASSIGKKIVIGACLTKWGSASTVKTLAAPCEGPIGEIMFMLDYYLRKHNRRHETSITVFTPGKIFFEDVGEKVHKDMEPIIKKSNINVVTNKVLKHIDKEYVEFEDSTKLECDMAIIIPPYKGPKFLIDSNLTDEAGFVPTDKYMRHVKYENIFAAGDINASSMPKLGHIAVKQSHTAASVIISEITQKNVIVPFKPEILCIMNRGENATLILSDWMYGGNRDLTLSGKIPKFMKMGFDSYYFYSHGKMPPRLSEEYLSKLLVKCCNK